MELAEQVRKDLCSLSLEEATQYLPKAKTSKEQFFSESKYCSLHLVLTEAVRNVLSHEKLESFSLDSIDTYRYHLTELMR